MSEETNNQNNKKEFVIARTHLTLNIEATKRRFTKITFSDFKIKDDSDFFSEGDFVVKASVKIGDQEEITLGESQVFNLNTGNKLKYDWTTVVGHTATKLTIKLEIDEVDVFFDDKIIRFEKEVSTTENSENTITDNKYLDFSYSIEEIDEVTYKKYNKITGTVIDAKTEQPLNDTTICLFKKNKWRTDKEKSFTGSQANKLKSKKNLGWKSELKITTGADGKFEFSDLTFVTTDDVYIMKVLKRGYLLNTVEFRHSHQDIKITLKENRVKPTGKVVDSNNNQGIGNATVKLYKLFAKIIYKPSTAADKGLNVYSDEGADSSQMIGELPENTFCEIIYLPSDYPNLAKDKEMIKIRYELDDQLLEGWILGRNKEINYSIVCSSRITDVKTSSDGTFEIDNDAASTCHYHEIRVVKYAGAEKLGKYFDGETSWIDYRQQKDDVIISMKRCVNENGEGLLLNESDVTKWLDDFNGWTYGYPVRYPTGFDIPGINEQHPSTTNEQLTVCCTFVEGLLVQSWNKLNNINKSIIQWEWNLQRHKQSQVSSSDYQQTYFQWESVNVYNDTNMAETPYSININSYSNSNIPKPWSVCQMWPNNPNTGPIIQGSQNPGHNFIVFDVHKYSGRVLTLESRGSGLDASQSGPQYRWIGNIGDNMPGELWYADRNCWEIRKFYEYLSYNKLAQLRIYNRTFIENSSDDAPAEIKNGILEGGY